MLTGDDKNSLERINMNSNHIETRVSKMLSFEWIGQTLASLCWIISVFVYGLNSTGDWLQLMACLLYTSPSPRDRTRFRMPSSA